MKPILYGCKKTEWAKVAALLLSGSLAITASAYTVYDAGKALRQNCESGSYANPYTDANGGAFNGLTLVGNVSELTGMMIIVR